MRVAWSIEAWGVVVRHAAIFDSERECKGGWKRGKAHKVMHGPKP